MIDQLYSHHEMCAIEGGKMLQRGMNFRITPKYSVILLSQRPNAPYTDKIYPDGITLEYEGHDVTKAQSSNPKGVDQPEALPSGKLTENGKFIEAVKKHQNGAEPELVKAYEKIKDGIWSLKGYFDLIDYRIVNNGQRNVFRFILRLSEREASNFDSIQPDLAHTRLIPTQVKKEVWERDGGKCVLCEETKNLHFDHDLPFSKGGTSLSAKNIKLLCMKHNLQKSAKIE